MSWRERARPCAMTSPSGTRYPFQYRALSRETPLRTREFVFGNVSGGYIQQSGTAPQRFPMLCIFHGDDCDIEADSFELALAEQGLFRLHHPTYGDQDVKPVGAIVRRDDLINEANKAVVEVTFSRSLASIYPSGTPAPRATVLNTRAAMNAAIASQFGASLKTPNALARASAINDARNVLGAIKSTLRDISTAIDTVNGGFDLQESILSSTLDTLIGTPLTLAADIIALTQLPGQAFASIKAQLDGYKALADALFGIENKKSGSSLPSAKLEADNTFFTNDMGAGAAASGAVLASVSASYRSRNEAVSAAESLAIQFEDSVNWRETKIKTRGLTEQSDSHQLTQQTIAQAVGFLVNSSLSLRPEKTLVITRPRNMVELCFELYGNVQNATLDEFTQHNDINGNEFFELPRGRVISYYA